MHFVIGTGYVEAMTPASTPPFTRAQARKAARDAVLNGAIVYAEPHAKDRMRERKISAVDVENVLRGGFVREEPEFSEKCSWRYKVCTNRFEVVVEFWPGGRVFVVSLWRTK